MHTMKTIQNADGQELNYEQMLAIYEEYQTCTTFEEKLELWKRHRLDLPYINVWAKDGFLIASMVLLDFNLNDIENTKLIGEYAKELAMRLPYELNRWSVDKLKTTYWQRINLSPNPKEVLRDYLEKREIEKKFEREIDQHEINEYNYEEGFEEETLRLSKKWGYDFANKGLARDKDAINGGFGEAVSDWFRFNDYHIHSLTYMGQLLLRFEDGIELAKFHGFLENEHQRLNSGEDIRYPETEEEKQEREYVENNRGVLKLKWKGKPGILYRLVVDLTEENIQREGARTLAAWIRENFENVANEETIRVAISKIRKESIVAEKNKKQMEKPKGHIDLNKFN